MNAPPCTVFRLSRVTPAAWSLLRAYFDEVGVVLRDTAEELDRTLSQHGAGLWLARCQGEAAGCVLLRPLPDIPGASECKRLYVLPAFRGRGLASMLLDGMEPFAIAAGWNAIYLDSKDDLHAALRIYQARGYEPCARYNANPQATVFLRKLLAGAAGGVRVADGGERQHLKL